MIVYALLLQHLSLGAGPCIDGTNSTNRVSRSDVENKRQSTNGVLRKSIT